MSSEFNLIHTDLPESDKELFFGPIRPDDKFITFDNSAKMEDIMAMTGKFPSKGQARKNGYSGDIPEGFTSLTIGKGKNRADFFILNKF